jgi:antitoxin PrlF
MGTSYEATVTSKGQITIPKAVRDRLDIEEGETVLFRFDEDGSVRIVVVPSDPMDRFELARERAEGIDVDVQELIDRERAQWDRLQ